MSSDRELPADSRLRVLGGAAWRNRLRAVLGDREVAWTLRRLEGWGELMVAATRDGTCRVHLGGLADVEAEAGATFAGGAPALSAKRNDALLAPFADRIAEFLAAPDSVVLDLPVDAAGTEFQREVWQALAAIPAGNVKSYKELAVAVGRPSASRAVGGACGANPVPLVLPCHRVVGSDGKLTGFGLGVAVKERLLQAEAGVRTLPL